MKEKTLIALSVSLLAYLTAMPLRSDQAAPEAQEKKAAAATEKEAAGSGERLAPPETISGTIMIVNPEKRLLIVKAASGVPFNFVVGASTRIRSGKQRLKLSDLAGRTDKAVTVKFVPTRKGNVAQSIEIPE